MLKMEIRSWICFFVVCTFSASAQTEEEGEEEINFTDCWNYGKKLSIFEAPAVQNFKDCGRWNGKEIAPWAVSLGTGDDLQVWSGVLLSDETIISHYWRFLYTEEKEKIKIYAGRCEGLKRCHNNLGLLENKKVLDVKELKLKHGRFFSHEILVWRIEKLDLTPNLQPVCLWNRDNRNDEHEIFNDLTHWNNLREVDFVPEQRCYRKEKIEKRECDVYRNSICTSGRVWSDFLYIEREGRFYLRAILTAFLTTTSRWVDLLPFTNEITSAASVVLASPPKIPKPVSSNHSDL